MTTTKRGFMAAQSVLDDASVLIERLQSDMDQASERLDYERAARIRDMIGSVQSAKSENIVSSRFYQDSDAVGFATSGDSGCLVILHAKKGMIRGQTEYQLIHRGDVSDSVSSGPFWSTTPTGDRRRASWFHPHWATRWGIGCHRGGRSGRGQGAHAWGAGQAQDHGGQER